MVKWSVTLPLDRPVPRSNLGPRPPTVWSEGQQITLKYCIIHVIKTVASEAVKNRNK